LTLPTGREAVVIGRPTCAEFGGSGGETDPLPTGAVHDPLPLQARHPAGNGGEATPPMGAIIEPTPQADNPADIGGEAAPPPIGALKEPPLDGKLPTVIDELGACKDPPPLLANLVGCCGGATRCDGGVGTGGVAGYRCDCFCSELGNELNSDCGGG
jgi:hypothetical protein